MAASSRERQPPELRRPPRSRRRGRGSRPAARVVLPEDRPPFSVSPSSFSERSRSSNLLSDRTCTRAGRDVPVELPEQRPTRSFHPTSATSTRGTSTGIVSSRRRPVSPPPAAARPGASPSASRARKSESAVCPRRCTRRVVVRDEAVVGGAHTTPSSRRQAQDHGRPKMPPDVLEGPPAAARPVGADHFYVLALERQQVQRHGAHGRDGAHRTSAAPTTVAEIVLLRSPPTRSKTCVDCDRRNSAINLDLGADGSASGPARSKARRRPSGCATRPG